MAAPLRITPSTIAAVHAGRLDANQATELADMLANALADPQAAAAALGLELEYSRAEALARGAARDAVIRAAAQSLAASMSINGKAKLIHRALTNYRAGGWRRESYLDECPTRLRGLDRYCWRALRFYDADVSVRTLRKKLAASAGGGQLDRLDKSDGD